MTTFLRYLNSLRWSLVAAAIAAMLLAPSLSGGAPATSSGLEAYYD